MQYIGFKSEKHGGSLNETEGKITTVYVRKIRNGQSWPVFNVDSGSVPVTVMVCGASGFSYTGAGITGMGIFPHVFKKCPETLPGELYVLPLRK